MTIAGTPDPRRVQELIDRQDIHDALLRYCRGVDRHDEELLRTAYWPGAIDDHGVFRGPVEEFIPWCYAGHEARHDAHQHYIMNHTCEINGDTAHTETYMMMMGKNKEGTPVTLHAGRYIDQLEKRHGEWLILHRVSVVEWTGGLTTPDLPPVQREQNATVAWDRTDTSYDRPLATQERLNR